MRYRETRAYLGVKQVEGDESNDTKDAVVVVTD